MDVFDGLPILFPFERASDEEGRRRSVKNRKEEEEEKKKKKKKKKGNELFDSNSFESKHLLHKTTDCDKIASKSICSKENV